MRAREDYRVSCAKWIGVQHHFIQRFFLVVANEIWHESLVVAIFVIGDDFDVLIDIDLHAVDANRVHILSLCVETPDAASEAWYCFLNRPLFG